MLKHLKHMPFLKIINTLRNRPNFVFWVLVVFLLAFNLANCQQATHYSDYYIGKITANGDVFVQDKFTCASNNYPFGTILRVFYKGKYIDVRVNDRMVDSGVIDLSKLAFSFLAPLSVGRIKVKIKIIKK